MLRFPIIVIILLVAINSALAYRILGSEGEWSEYRKLRSELRAENDRSAQLFEENQLLRAEIADLKEGQEILEEIARFDLGLVREGEFIINLTKARPGQGADASARAIEPAVGGGGDR